MIVRCVCCPTHTIAPSSTPRIWLRFLKYLQWRLLTRTGIHIEKPFHMAASNAATSTIFVKCMPCDNKTRAQSLFHRIILKDAAVVKYFQILWSRKPTKSPTDLLLDWQAPLLCSVPGEEHAIFDSIVVMLNRCARGLGVSLVDLVFQWHIFYIRGPLNGPAVNWWVTNRLLCRISILYCTVI